jgi:hypothetical protein
MPAAVRWLVIVLILVAEFAVLEAGLRVYGSFEGTTTFQSLFMADPFVGVRLRPGASIRYTTVEFTADIRVNAQGVRDDEPLGPKAPGERRIVVLGDSLVLSVQVPLAQTFCEILERRLNAAAVQALAGHQWRRAGLRAGAGVVLLRQDRGGVPARRRADCGLRGQ